MTSSSSSASRTWIALSGGVDSAVSAAILLEQGHHLTAVTMRLVEPGTSPAHDASIKAAAAVSDALGIDHRVIDVTTAFSLVVKDSHELRCAGATPNPCVICNETVKFGFLLEQAIASGASTLATGHYTRLVTIDDGSYRLARGRDEAKDQSYFLYRLSSPTLRSCVFPLGELTKDSVVAKARELELPVLSGESQDICVPELFEVATESRSGHIVDDSGTVLGQHTGIAAFTVGQRKGIGLGGGEPLYVLAVDHSTGNVTVGPRSALQRHSVRAVDSVWHGPDELSCLATVRYRSAPQPAAARLRDGMLHIDFDEPIDAPAPGQSVVCYEGDTVIGGGVIVSAS